MIAPRKWLTRAWLLVAATALAGAVPGADAQAQTPAPPPAEAQPPQNATPGVATPGVATPGGRTPDDAADEGFIEFLGSDDVGDAAWWEFLKRAPPRGNTPTAPPPQDASK